MAVNVSKQSFYSLKNIFDCCKGRLQWNTQAVHFQYEVKKKA